MFSVKLKKTIILQIGKESESREDTFTYLQFALSHAELLLLFFQF